MENGLDNIRPDEEINTYPLHEPPIEEIISILTTGLQRYFEYVDVTYTACPNLTLEPYNLAAKGLHGNEMLISCLDIFQNSPERLIGLWDLRETMELWTPKIPPSFTFLIGGGYALTPVHPSSGILIMNATHSAPIHYNNESCVVFKDTNSDNIGMETLRSPEHMMCCMNGNFFMSKGEEGNVLKISVKRRKPASSPQRINIIEVISNILLTDFGVNDEIGLGGILIIERGKVTHQVLSNNVDIKLRNFSNLNTIHSEINDPPFLISLGTIFGESMNDPDLLKLMFNNFYTFSNDENGGLFLNDTSSDNIEYVGYFNIAKKIYLPHPVY